MKLDSYQWQLEARRCDSLCVFTGVGVTCTRPHYQELAKLSLVKVAHSKHDCLSNADYDNV